MSKLTIVILIILMLLGGALLIRKLRTPKSIFAEPLIPTPLYEPVSEQVTPAPPPAIVAPIGTTTR